jgi:hypothetical protein
MVMEQQILMNMTDRRMARDLDGRLLKQTVSINQSHVFSEILDLTSFRDGIYTVTMITPSNIITKRILLIN